MQIGQSAPTRKPIPLTPLVDIVFLLLMFFMLSSTFTKFGSLATGTTGTTGDAGATVNAPMFPGAIVLVAGEGQLRVNGVPADLAHLPGLLDELHAKRVTRAALRAGSQASVQDLVSALDAARQSQIPDITVAR